MSHQSFVFIECPLAFLIDCGVANFVYPIYSKLHDKIVARNLPHDSIERPGKHNWPYWENAVQYPFLFFKTEDQ